ncbi:MAG: Family ership [Pseudomonadota bacterium]|jgi:fatty acid amide hydrolase 2
MDDLLTLSATRLADLVRSREVGSREVVEAHIDRAQRVNPTLNAIVRDRYEAARREADSADQALRESGPTGLPPLHGVPCTIKECFALEGMPNSSGLVSRRNVISGRDATAVARVRAAGAIPIGVTNVSELCMWMETNNRVYGRTNNPYDPERIVGGSSGGEGAIVGAGASPFGIGSDIGGSIRMPAFFNGVFGHKPSGGLVPGTGQYPMAHGDALRYLTTGPICRRAEDLWPLLKILAGPDGEDAGCREMPLGDPATVRFAGMRVVTVPDDGVRSPTRDLQEAQARAAAELARAGAIVTEARVKDLRYAFDIWSAMLSAAGGPSFREMLADGGPSRPGVHLLRWLSVGSPHTLPALVLALVEPLPKLTPGRTRRMLERGRELRAALDELVGDGVMLYPPYPEPAPRHARPLMSPFNWVYTAILNVMELPVTQVPMGLNAEGLPLGVQVAARAGADHRTIAVARLLEERVGGWVPPRLASA